MSRTDTDRQFETFSIVSVADAPEDAAAMLVPTPVVDRDLKRFTSPAARTRRSHAAALRKYSTDRMSIASSGHPATICGGTARAGAGAAVGGGLPVVSAAMRRLASASLLSASSEAFLAASALALACFDASSAAVRAARACRRVSALIVGVCARAPDDAQTAIAMAATVLLPISQPPGGSTADCESAERARAVCAGRVSGAMAGPRRPRRRLRFRGAGGTVSRRRATVRPRRRRAPASAARGCSLPVSRRRPGPPSSLVMCGLTSHPPR